MIKVLFVERNRPKPGSIERVFREIAINLSGAEFDSRFQSVPYGNGILAILRNLFFYRRGEADVYHIAGDVHYIAMLLPGQRTVLTIHDLVFLRQRTGLRLFFLRKLYLDMPLRRAKYVTTVSQSTKDEIVKMTGIEADRITVIENPLLTGFSYVPRIFNSDVPTILHIGTAPNKNLSRLIAAVEGMSCKLRIVGEIGLSDTALLESNAISYVNLRDLDDEAMLQEYRNADIVAFCSTYEGFGLPVIEAQAIGRPVVTSDISPMKEIAGKGAVLVDPHDVRSIRAGIERVIHDAEERKSLIEAGLINVERFRAEKASIMYAAIYKKIVAEN